MMVRKAGQPVFSKMRVVNAGEDLTKNGGVFYVSVM